jgi:anti-sigma-K factor RskA
VTNEAERLARAGNYVLGMMDAAERERAERDLVADAAFRDAVVQVAERMHLFEVPAADKAEDQWAAIAARLAELPQMRALGLRDAPNVVSLHAAAVTPRRAIGQPLHALGGRRGFVVALVLIAVFAIGYVAGRL